MLGGDDDRYRDHIYAALGVPPETEEEELSRRQRRDSPPPRAKARERKLDTPLLTIDDVDQRVGLWIAAEHERMMEILAHVLAHLQDDESAALVKVPGPMGPPGQQAALGR